MPNAERMLDYPSLDALNARRVIFHSQKERDDLALRRVQVYENTLVAVERKPDLRAVYEATLRSEPIERSAFRVYRMDKSLALVKEPCAASFLTEQKARLRIVPVDQNDLPYWRRDKGFELRNVSLSGYGALFDGKCVAQVPLPDYPVADVKVLWSPPLIADDAARGAVRRAVEAGRLLGRGEYDIYLSSGDLVYVKEQCDPNETESRFFLHAVPERKSDLPAERRLHGFNNLDFDFFLYGALFDENCAAMVPSPEYPIASIRTGQFIRGVGEIWSMELAAGG